MRSSVVCHSLENRFQLSDRFQLDFCGDSRHLNPLAAVPRVFIGEKIPEVGEKMTSHRGKDDLKIGEKFAEIL